MMNLKMICSVWNLNKSVLKAVCKMQKRKPDLVGLDISQHITYPFFSITNTILLTKISEKHILVKSISPFGGVHDNKKRHQFVQID